jgi:hypothetical protein
MSRRSIMDEIRLPSREEPIAAITILDGKGRVVRVVSANEFRRGPILRRQLPVRGRGGRGTPGKAFLPRDTPAQSLPAPGRSRLPLTPKE